MLLACFGGREKDNQFQNDVRDFFFKLNLIFKIRRTPLYILGYGWRPAWSYSQSESGSKWR